MNRDLTVGKPSTVLWKFCMPLLGSIIFQQMYNLADSWVAGKFISQNALAAVGNSYEITLIFLAFAFGCNIGCSVLVSQLFGAKDYGKMKTAVYTTMISSSIICLVLMAVGILGCNGLLRLINTPAEVFDDSALYLDIYVWGLPFVFFYNISTGIFSALGDSRTPFWFLAASSVANIAMDILFVTAFSMGVAGVAWATFICQGVSCVLAVTVVLQRLRKIPTDGTVKWFSGDLFGRFAVIAVPSTLQQSCVSIGNVMVQSVVNGFGTDVMAGFSAAAKLNGLATTCFTTLGNGVSNYAAQNLGAGKKERIAPGAWAGVRLIWLVCLPLVALYCICGESLMGFFMDEPTAGALESGRTFLRIVSPFYFVISVKLAVDGVLRGTGMMKQFVAGTFTDLLLRVILAFLLSATALGATGVWCAWPIGWTVATVMSVLFYRAAPWKKTHPLRENAR